MNIETDTELEEMGSDGSRLRLWVITIVDGVRYRTVHASGTKRDVSDYYNGKITLEDLRNRWSGNTGR